jgi:Fe-Mn family superoxide dismutase
MDYSIQDYSRLIGTAGFSDTLLNNHFTLYQGYVKNTNKLMESLASMLKEDRTASPEYAEIKRRMGFEFNGMRLHECYFSNLGGDGDSAKAPRLQARLTEDFGSLDAWEKDFRATGAMRGIGWVVLYQDNLTGRLFNQWINEHEAGHWAGCTIILVMDVFEHAFLTDYGLKRAAYIDAFFGNIDWAVLEDRLN